jgi:hypothetical protein
MAIRGTWLSFASNPGRQILFCVYCVYCIYHVYCVYHVYFISLHCKREKLWQQH